MVRQSHALQRFPQYFQHPPGTIHSYYNINDYIPYAVLYLSIFRERERKGERQGEKHQCVFASHTPPAGDLAHNPGTCPDWELNQQPFGSQANLCSTLHSHNYSISTSPYFLIPSPFSYSLPAVPLPSDSHQSVLCICESVFLLFVHLFCCLDSTYK